MVVISCIVHGSLAAAKKRKLISENVAAGAEIICDSITHWIKK